MPDRLSKVDRANLQEFADRKRTPITIAEARSWLAMMAQDLLDVDERRAEIEVAAGELRSRCAELEAAIVKARASDTRYQCRLCGADHDQPCRVGCLLRASWDITTGHLDAERDAADEMARILGDQYGGVECWRGKWIDGTQWTCEPDSLCPGCAATTAIRAYRAARGER